MGPAALGDWADRGALSVCRHPSVVGRTGPVCPVCPVWDGVWEAAGVEGSEADGVEGSAAEGDPGCRRLGTT